MANTRAGNVVKVDTSGLLSDVRSIEAIKYIGNTSVTALSQKGSSSGANLLEESGTGNVFNEVCIECPNGVYVTVTNSAVVYLYLK